MEHWITDRPPTEADEDKDGEVCMLRFPDNRESSVGGVDALVSAAHVGPGVPWKHTYEWKPPAEPEPTPPPEPDFDSLVEHEPAVAPKTCKAFDDEFHPLREIPKSIQTGAAPFYVLLVSDDAAGKPGGNPIVWEHYMPEGTTLQSALQQQLRIGSQFGTSYVAECRIIPELTRDVHGDPDSFITERQVVTAQQVANTTVLEIKTGSVIDILELLNQPGTIQRAKQPRKFKSLTRTNNEDGTHTVDAIDEEGIAWWMIPDCTEWTPLTPLPAREVPADA